MQIQSEIYTHKRKGRLNAPSFKQRLDFRRVSISEIWQKDLFWNHKNVLRRSLHRRFWSERRLRTACADRRLNGRIDKIRIRQIDGPQLRFVCTADVWRRRLCNVHIIAGVRDTFELPFAVLVVPANILFDKIEIRFRYIGVEQRYVEFELFL